MKHLRMPYEVVPQEILMSSGSLPRETCLREPRLADFCPIGADEQTMIAIASSIDTIVSIEHSILHEVIVDLAT